MSLGAFAQVPIKGSTVDASTGYTVAGAAGTSGQALCSNATVFNTACNFYSTVASNGSAVTSRPKLNLINGGLVSVSCVDNSGSNETDCSFGGSVGSLYYQTVQNNGTSLPQQPVLSTDVTLTATGGTGKTTIGLTSVGSGGTFNAPSQIVVDAYGRTTGVTSTSLTITSGYQVEPSGLILEEGLISSGSSTTSVSFPLTFPHAALSITFGTDNTTGTAGRDVCYISTPLSTTGVGVSTGGSTVSCHYIAIGW